MFEELPLTLHSLLTETFRWDSDKDELTNLVELSHLFTETHTNLKQYLENYSFKGAVDIQHIINIIENLLIRKCNTSRIAQPTQATILLIAKK